MPTRTRLHILDLIRGITLLSMISYHAAYDLVYLYGLQLPGYRGTEGYVWQQSICWTFILLSGFCVPLGERRHQLRRGLLLSACGALITAVTFLTMPSSPVIMGVLSFYGLAVLLTALLGPLLRRIPAIPGALVCLLLFFLTRNIPSGGLGFEAFTLVSLPESLYANPFTMILGFPYPGFYSSDYFPLLPWTFLFWTGFFTGTAFFAAPLRIRRPLTPSLCPPLQWIGRHTLLLYMFHQPLLMGIFQTLDAVGVF